MTLRDAVIKLRAYGIILTKREGEYRVNFRGGKESTAYYTDDLQDAVNTGIAMYDQRYPKNPFRLGSRRVRYVKSMRSPIRGRRKVTYRKKSVALRHTNPGTLIYSQITRIEGTKGKGSQFPGQKFFHKFRRPYPAMYGLKDGSLLIK